MPHPSLRIFEWCDAGKYNSIPLNNTLSLILGQKRSRIGVIRQSDDAFLVVNHYVCRYGLGLYEKSGKNANVVYDRPSVLSLCSGVQIKYIAIYFKENKQLKKAESILTFR